MQRETMIPAKGRYPDPEFMFSVQSELTQLIIAERGTDGLLSYLSRLTGSAAALKTSGFTAASDDCRDPGTHRLLTEILARGECLGVLSLVRTGAPFSEVERALVRLAAGFFAIQLASDRRIAEIELRLTGNVVEDLIFAHSPDYAPIISRAKALNYDLAQPHRVLVARPDSFAESAKRMRVKPENLGAELAKAIQGIFRTHDDGLVVFRTDELIILVRQRVVGDSFDDVNEFAEQAVSAAETALRLKLFVGIGSICTKPEEYKASYRAAKKALEIGEFMITEGQIRSFEKFRIHALFLSTLKPDELIEYAKNQLGALLDYDIAHKSELLKTLQEFLYLRNNIEGTAKSLNMSVSGLKYRLGRIEKILAKDLKDNKVSFDLQLALIILQLFGEYRIKIPSESAEKYR